MSFTELDIGCAFASVPVLDFANVNKGEEKVGFVKILNKGGEKGKEKTISLQPISTKSPFAISPTSITLCTSQVIGINEEIEVSFLWIPKEGGNVRDKVTFLINNKLKLQVVLIGCCTDTKKVAPLREKNSVTTSHPASLTASPSISPVVDYVVTKKGGKEKVVLDENANAKDEDDVLVNNNFLIPSNKNLNIRKVKRKDVDLEIENFIVTKEAIKEAPRKATPSKMFKKTLVLLKPKVVTEKIGKEVHKKAFYDERWVDKQSKCFVKWINFTLRAAENDPLEENTSLTPSSDTHALNMLIIKRREADTRRKAVSLYLSRNMEDTFSNIEREVEEGKLAIRSDRHLYADVGWKETFISLLLSYNYDWLKLGLETVFGELLTLDGFSNANVGEQLLKVCKRFINEKLISDPEILSKFKTTKEGVFGPQFTVALHKHTLKKFLFLVHFLDQARNKSLLPNSLCLFQKDGDIKSSKEMVLRFSKVFLSGEGDVTRHLSLLGYTVSYSQNVIDEIEYRVNKLESDLRDGIMLARLLEVLSKDESRVLSHSLRLPIVSRLQKIHNVGLSFKKMIELEMDVSMNLQNAALKDITHNDIVMGHAQKTLGILWQIVLKFEISALLSMSTLEREIHSLSLKHGQTASNLLSMCPSTPPSSVERDVDNRIGFPFVNEEVDKGRVENETDKLFSHLFRWAQHVLCNYGISLHDWTHSFSDGKAFLYLLHHYHPSLIEMNDILPTTNDLQKAVDDASHYHSNVTEGDISNALDNELRNFKTLNHRLAQLGGIPLMLPLCNTVRVCEERSLITFLSYLCCRLLESSQQIRATKLIQKTWKRYTHHKFFLKKRRASFIITKAASNYMLAIKKKLLLKKRGERIQKAIILQSFYRGYVARKYSQELRSIKYAREISSVIIIQSFWRSFSGRMKFLTFKIQAIYIQRKWRAHSQRIKFLKIKNAVNVLQRTFSRFLQMMLKKRQTSATTIQSLFRGHVARITYKKMLLFLLKERSSLKIQSIFRGHLARLQYNNMLLHLKRERSATTIQSLFRGHVARIAYKEILLFLLKEKCVVKIQSIYRGHLARVYSCNLALDLLKIRSAILIQAVFRGHLARISYNNILLGIIKTKCAVTIQSLYRGHKARVKYNLILLDLLRERSAVKIQAYLRGHSARTKYVIMLLSLKKEKCAKRIQSVFHGYLARKLYKSMKLDSLKARSATLIQSLYRGHFARLAYKETLLFLNEERSAIRIQSIFRGHLARGCYNNMILDMLKNKSATAIQSLYRGFKARLHYHSLLLDLLRTRSAIRIQSIFRGHLARVRYNNMVIDILKNKSATTIQSLYRGFKARLHYHSLLLDLLKARSAALIQSIFRGHLARVRYNNMVLDILKNKSATTIQAVYRGHLAKLFYKNMALDILQNKSAVLIQSLHRGNVARLIFKQLLFSQLREKSAIKMQSLFKGHLARNHYKEILLNQLRERNATQIQAIFRGYLERKNYQNILLTLFKEKCATKIQSFYRGRLAKAQLSIIKSNIIIIQSKIRMFIARLKFRYFQSTCILIQAQWRGKLARTRFLKSIKSIRLIQSVSRRFLVLNKIKKNKCASKIQSIFRMHQCKGLLTEKKKERKLIQQIVLIQSIYRGRKDRLLYLHHKESLLEERRVLRLQHNSAAIIQNIFRIYQKNKLMNVNVVVLQRIYRGYKGRMRAKNRMKVILFLQSTWRGRKVRVKCNKKMKAIMKRSIIANNAVEETSKLKSRTQMALETLLSSKNLTHVMKACISLEVSTRYSKKCRASLAATGAVSVLYALIRSCNRSDPHMKVLDLSLKTLNHIANDKEVLDKITEPSLKCVDTLMELIQSTTQHVSINTDAIELLYLLCQSANAKLPLLSNIDYMKRLNALHSTFVRRKTNEERRKSIAVKENLRDKGKDNKGSEKQFSNNKDSVYFLSLLLNL